MSLDKDWDSIRPDRSRAADAGMGILRVTLLFGSAAVALALIATPFLASQMRSQSDRDGLANGLDMTSTGSVGHRDTYTLRRSVLQSLPSSICVIRANGKRSGDC